MIKKIVVAGSRDYNDYAQAKDFIDFCIQKLRTEYTLVFVSGGCRGADAIGERYAAENGFSVEIHPADWEGLGRCAGVMRNEQMACAADYVIAFWDGKSRGTRSMLQCAIKHARPVRVLYTGNDA